MTCSRGRELFELGRQTEPTRRQALKSRFHRLPPLPVFIRKSINTPDSGNSLFSSSNWRNAPSLSPERESSSPKWACAPGAAFIFFVGGFRKVFFHLFGLLAQRSVVVFQTFIDGIGITAVIIQVFMPAAGRRSEPRPPHTATNGPRFSDSSFLLNGWIAMRRCRQPEPSCRRLRGLPSLKLCRSKSHRSRKCRRNR